MPVKALTLFDAYRSFTIQYNTIQKWFL